MISKQASMCTVMCPGCKLNLMDGSFFFVGNSSEAIENKRGRGYYFTTPIPILYNDSTGLPAYKIKYPTEI